MSRAPLAKLEAYRVSRSWTVPSYSSDGTDFNYDFQVTLDASVPQLFYSLLDLTALGRQEAWEGPKGRAPVRRDT